MVFVVFGQNNVGIATCTDMKYTLQFMDMLMRHNVVFSILLVTVVDVSVVLGMMLV